MKLINYLLLFVLIRLEDVTVFGLFQNNAFRRLRATSSRLAHFIADIPNPTGLKVTGKDGNFYFLLEHNCKELPAEYKKVYEINGALSDELCEEIMRKAEEYAALHPDIGWTKERHVQYPTTDLPLDLVFGPCSSLHAHIDCYVLPRIAAQFALNEDHLQIGEVFIVKYQFTPLQGSDDPDRFREGFDIDKNTYGSGSTISKTQTGLACHVDGCPWSFVLCLNDPQEYQSGGTYFPLIDEVHRPARKGTAVIFSGKNYHGGVPITSGVRYIVTGFLNYYNKNDYSHTEFMREYNVSRDGYAANCSLEQVQYLERGVRDKKATAIDRVFSCSSTIERGIRTGDILRGIVLSAPSDDDSQFNCDVDLEDDSLDSPPSFYSIAVESFESDCQDGQLRDWLVQSIANGIERTQLKEVLSESIRNRTIEITESEGEGEYRSENGDVLDRLLSNYRFQLLVERPDDDNCDIYQFVVRNRHHLLATENYLDFDDILESVAKAVCKPRERALAAA